MDMATRKIADKTLALFEDIFKILEPPKPLTVSTWAAEHRVLSRGASAEPGKWNLDRAPYQRIIMDAISDQTWRRIILMTSAQVGKTEIVLNAIGYYSEHDPSPILTVMPTEDMARDFSKDRLAAMIRDTKCLSEVYGKVKSRDSSNTILHKQFPGGYVKMIGVYGAFRIGAGILFVAGGVGVGRLCKDDRGKFPGQFVVTSHPDPFDGRGRPLSGVGRDRGGSG